MYSKFLLLERFDSFRNFVSQLNGRKSMKLAVLETRKKKGRATYSGWGRIDCCQTTIMGRTKRIDKKTPKNEHCTVQPVPLLIAYIFELHWNWNLKYVSRCVYTRDTIDTGDWKSERHFLCKSASIKICRFRAKKLCLHAFAQSLCSVRYKSRHARTLTHSHQCIPDTRINKSVFILFYVCVRLAVTLHFNQLRGLATHEIKMRQKRI